MRDRDRKVAMVEESSLASRIFELERDCADLREQNELARAVLAANRELASIRTPNLVVAHLMRAMRHPLSFGRSIYATIDRAIGVETKFQIDDGDVLEESGDQFDAGEGSALLRVIRGDAEGIGYAGELSAPLFDVRGWYVFCVLRAADGPFGVLYVDGHPSPTPKGPEAEFARNLASVAAVAIENGVLFERTHELASRDPLTGLFNRRAFSERVDATIRHCTATGAQFAYVLIDVDDFKRVNDRNGHAFGDALLRKLADVLERTSRTDDIVGRFAGDEFVIAINNVDAPLARSLVARLSAQLCQRGLHCSIGAALFPRDATGEHGLLEAADRALYNTKSAGKNGFSFY